MLLSEFIDGSRNGYIKAERYLNNGSPSGFSEINTTSENTSPRSLAPSFNLKQIKFTNDIFIEDFGEYRNNYVKEGCIFIHPDMLNSEGLIYNLNYFIEDELAVTPTASGRTVLALDKNYFIKLTYIGYLGRLIRHMSSEIIRSAYEVNKQLIVAAKTKKINDAFSFLREDFGRVAHIPINNLTSKDIELPLNSRGCYEWGVIFREFDPFPYIQEEEFFIPFFALFGKEYDPVTKKNLINQDKPLLIQLFEHQNKSIVDFLLYDILYPIFNTYFDALIFAGVELEIHAQNLLLTINKKYDVKRVVYRDLESAARDVPLMEYMGIDYVKTGEYKFNIIKQVEIGQKYPKYYVDHSFMFDFKLGEYLITPLIELAHKYYSFDHNSIIIKIKEFNRQFIEKLPNDFYPPDWCSYENINWDLEKRKREYIWHDNPKYR